VVVDTAYVFAVAAGVVIVAAVWVVWLMLL
jgi:hypothetical protein